MRHIEIPADAIRAWLDKPQGIGLDIPVKVGWPELQLTESQMMANAAAHAAGHRPFPDLSLFSVRITR